MTPPTSFNFELPRWVDRFVDGNPALFATLQARARFVIALSEHNIEHATGGPFGAAVFDEDGRLVSVGVNLVSSANCSILHAEMVAIALAQKLLGRYDLSAGGTRDFELVASTEPCAMCFGAVPWSGVKRLVCSAREEDARSVGFDEGAKVNDWPTALASRGIHVTRDIEREAAAAVLGRYAELGGVIYNPRPDA